MDLSPIFVVDDDIRVLQITEMEIEDCGYSCELFSSAHDFLVSIKTVKPSLVLLDLMMPDMNGLECLTQLAIFNFDFPVLMFTSVDDDLYRRQALDSGAKAYLLKSEFLASPSSIINRFIKH